MTARIHRLFERRFARVALVLTIVAPLLWPDTAAGQQARRYSLESPTGLRLHDVTAEPTLLHGRKGLRLTLAPDAAPPADRPASGAMPTEINQLAVIEGLEFSDGVIELEVAGEPGSGAAAAAGARGFVGLAFRVQSDMTTYDAFYLRPTNGGPTIRNAAIDRRSTSPTQIGPGSACARRARGSTNRMSTSYRGNGRGSRSTWVGHKHGFMFTAASNRCWSSTTSSQGPARKAPLGCGSEPARLRTSGISS